MRPRHFRAPIREHNAAMLQSRLWSQDRLLGMVRLPPGALPHLLSHGGRIFVRYDPEGREYCEEKPFELAGIIPASNTEQLVPPSLDSCACEHCRGGFEHASKIAKRVGLAAEFEASRDPFRYQLRPSDVALICAAAGGDAERGFVLTQGWRRMRSAEVDDERQQ